MKFPVFGKALLVSVFLLWSGIYINAQYNYQMGDARFSFGLGTMINTNRLGTTLAGQLRYSWRMGNGAENAVTVLSALPNKLSDTTHALAIRSYYNPQVIPLDVKYKYHHVAVMYSYHQYLMSEYDDPYGYYLGGAVGLMIWRVNYDRNLFDNQKYSLPNYEYRAGGLSICGSLYGGAHYQLADNFRAYGEIGPYMFRDANVAGRNEGSGYRLGINIQVGLTMSIDRYSSRF